MYARVLGEASHSDAEREHVRLQRARSSAYLYYGRELFLYLFLFAFLQVRSPLLSAAARLST